MFGSRTRGTRLKKLGRQKAEIVLILAGCTAGRKANELNPATGTLRRGPLLPEKAAGTATLTEMFGSRTRGHSLPVKAGAPRQSTSAWELIVRSPQHRN